MNNISYQGPFKNHLQNHVALKQAVGYKYKTDAEHLKRFDKFTLEKYPKATVLTKEFRGTCARVN
jgi:integrase/recombinase XerD